MSFSVYKMPISTHNAAGIDIDSDFLNVAVQENGKGPYVMEFPAKSHEEIFNFLRTHNVKHVAIEAKGVSWIPLFICLGKASFNVVLLNPHILTAVPGRKDDVKDCQWIRDVFSRGLGVSAIIPLQEITPLRELVRLHNLKIEAGSACINEMVKVLSLMNINLEMAVADITNKAGMSVINAIIGGEQDPLKLAEFWDSHCKVTKVEMATYLDGVYAKHHLIHLKQSTEEYQFKQSQLSELNNLVVAELEKIYDSMSKNPILGDGE
jgi:hypothetical protein